MIFAKPEYLLVLLMLPAFSLFLLWANKSRQQALASLGDIILIQRLSANISLRGRKWQTILWLFALTMFILALARPQWGSEVREIDQEGLQVMVALDISQSMLAEDIQPTRLDRAKLEIAEDVIERIYYWTNGNPRMTWDICSEVENKSKNTIITIETINKIVQDLYLTTFDKPPIDNIREIVKQDREIRNAIVEIEYKKGKEVYDNIKSKLYLAGIILRNIPKIF